MANLDPKKHARPWAFFLATNRKELRWIALNSACYGLGTVGTLSVSYFLGRIVDSLSGSDGTRELIIFLLIALFGREIFYRLGHFLEIAVDARIRATTKRALFAYSTTLSFSYFSERFAGQIAHQITTTADALERIKLTFTNTFIENSFAVIVSAAALVSVYPPLGLALALWSVLFVAGLLPITKRITTATEAFAAHSSNTSGALVDMYTNISTVKLYSKDSDRNSINTKIKKEYDSELALGKWSVIAYAYQGLAGVALGCALLFITIYAYRHGLITIGQIVLIIGVAVKILEDVYGIGHTISAFVRDRSECAQALKDILVEAAVSDGGNQLDNPWKSAAVSFDQVSFSYDGKKQVLKKLSLTIPAGQKLGIVGLSGAGKTTFMNLLIRFFDPQSGSIAINGIDIASISQQELRSHISFISQDTSLFHASVADNIRYGSPRASRTAVRKAANQAFADEFISALPKGYDTIVGERGVKLSGGQRQRIAIARAMLKNSPLFLLDEATSALDSDSEAKVQAALQKLMNGKTVIAIAHRLSTLQKMDRIVFLEKGKIIEDGTHEELLAQRGSYAKLWKMQAGGFLPEKL